MTEARIRLAEAMNLDWRDCIPPRYRIKGVFILKPNQGRPGNSWLSFNPFKDANDDYAVLEWFRSGAAVKYPITKEDFDWHPVLYQIGDYARACLKVIDEQ